MGLGWVILIAWGLFHFFSLLVWVFLKVLFLLRFVLAVMFSLFLFPLHFKKLEQLPFYPLFSLSIHIFHLWFCLLAGLEACLESILQTKAVITPNQLEAAWIKLAQYRNQVNKPTQKHANINSTAVSYRPYCHSFCLAQCWPGRHLCLPEKIQKTRFIFWSVSAITSRSYW